MGVQEGGYSGLDSFCRNWRGASSLRHKGQTGLISLLRPLKFLPWDINEVIHRKAAARHPALLPSPVPAHPIRAATYFNLHSPSPPAALWLHLGRAALCQGRSPYNSPWELDSSRSMALSRRRMRRGGCVQLCVCHHARRGWQLPGFVSHINRKKHNVSTAVSIMVWAMVVLSLYFIYFSLSCSVSEPHCQE